MSQIFEVTWSEGTVTPELISSLLRQYVTQGGLYGTVVVKEAAQQSVQPTLLESVPIIDADGELVGTRSIPINPQSG